MKSEFRDYTDVKVDASGNTSLEGNISGEATFRWVFYAEIYKDSSDGGKKDGSKKDGDSIIDIIVPTGDNWPIAVLFWSLVIMSIVFFILAKKRQKDKEEKKAQ